MLNPGGIHYEYFLFMPLVLSLQYDETYEMCVENHYKRVVSGMYNGEARVVEMHTSVHLHCFTCGSPVVYWKKWLYNKTAEYIWKFDSSDNFSCSRIVNSGDPFESVIIMEDYDNQIRSYTSECITLHNGTILEIKNLGKADQGWYWCGSQYNKEDYLFHLSVVENLRVKWVQSQQHTNTKSAA
ncbi:hypothetical protein GJ496_008073 [Pomphorhynchus laevis]|nr:hypothetical protein GJ496_008073 [Pomphorhynchus laevis]